MTTSDQPMDHVPPGAKSDDKPEPGELQRNMTAGSTWVRFLFMILFGFLYGISRIVTAAVVIIQFVNVLITGDTNEQLKTFGHSLAIYSYEIVDYLTFNSGVKPFPLDAKWPESLPEEPGSADTDEEGA